MGERIFTFRLSSMLGTQKKRHGDPPQRKKGQ